MMVDMMDVYALMGESATVYELMDAYNLRHGTHLKPGDIRLVMYKLERWGYVYRAEMAWSDRSDHDVRVWRKVDEMG